MSNKPKDTNDDVPGTAPTAPSGDAGAQASSEASAEEKMGNMMLGHEPPQLAQDGGEEAEQSGESPSASTGAGDKEEKTAAQKEKKEALKQAVGKFRKYYAKFNQDYEELKTKLTGSARLHFDTRGDDGKVLRHTLLVEAVPRGTPTDPVPTGGVPPPLPTAVATADPELVAEELPDADPPQPPPVRERPPRAERRDRDEQPTPDPVPTARWAQINLALTGLCALLLLGVLVAVLTSKPAPAQPGPQLPSTLADDIAGKVKGAVPQQRDYTGPAKSDVAKLDEDITALNMSVKNLGTKIGELKPAGKGGVPPKDVTDAITAVRTELAALNTKIGDLKPDGKGGVPPKDVTDAIAAFKVQLTALNTKLDDKLKPAGGATPKDVTDALTAVKTDVNNALATFKTELSNVAKKQGATPTDVVIVVTNGRAMDANDYKPALSGALANPPQGRDKDAVAKVGLVVAETNRLAVVVPPDAPLAKIEGFGLNPQASEEPALLGEQFAEQKELKSGRLKRFVLVVSAGCKPLGANAAGWKDFKEVHVVLVARKEGDAEKAELVKWHEFAAARGGTVSVIGHGDAATQNRVLGERLKLLSHPLN